MKKTLTYITIAASLFVAFQAAAEDAKPVVKTTEAEKNAISQKADDIEVIQHKDGSKSADLKGRFQMYSVARVVDGKIVYSCQNHDHLDSDGDHIHTQKTAVERGVQ